MNFDSKRKIMYYKRLNKFLSKYGNKYRDDMREFIMDTFYDLDDINHSPDILLEVYAALGMLEKNENFYLGFAQMIGKKYGYDVNILEVGGGCYPAFAKYMRSLQLSNQGIGTVTVYDPLLVTESSNHLDLIKDKFDSNVDVSKYDLLVGILPCDATDIIVDSAIHYDKDFFIAMCDCLPDGMNQYCNWQEYNLLYKNWIDDIYTKLYFDTNETMEVKKEYVREFIFNNPIISGKKKI